MRSHSDLRLPDLFEIRPDEGVIRLHEQRVLLISAAAFGVLRRELIAAVGIEMARRLLVRFGFICGYYQAAAAIASSPLVAYVERDMPRSIHAQTVPTGIKRVFADANSNVDIDGADDFRVDVDVR